MTIIFKCFEKKRYSTTKEIQDYLHKYGGVMANASPKVTYELNKSLYTVANKVINVPGTLLIVATCQKVN